MFDILIKNARIVDGTGNPWFRGDIGVRGDRIAAIGRLIGTNATQVIDAEDRVVCPGFIDAHIHTDAVLLAEPQHEASLYQGVTTHIIGQDGFSFAPASPKTMTFMREYTAGINGQFDLDWGWSSVSEFLVQFDGRTAVNVAYLIPHGCLRSEAMGLEDRPPTLTELARMQALAQQGMAEGAIGFSTGLEYIPCIYADTDELVAIGQAVAPWGGVFVTHMRNYRDRVAEAVEEALMVGEQAGIGVHISHYNGPADVLLPLIDAGRSRGVDVTFDTYPYLAGSTILAMICLPKWVQAGGIPATVERLRQPEVRERLRPWLESPEREWHRIRLSFVHRPDQRIHEGLSPVEAAQRAGKGLTDFVCDLLVDNAMSVGCVIHQTGWRTEEDMRRIMGHRAHMAGSDGIFVGGRPHPRGWGTFARYLGVYTRKLGVYELEAAVRHLSSHAAQRFGLRDRGLVREGYAADLIVFDPDTIIDRSTYENGRQLAEGVTDVLVNGQFVLCHGEPTGILPGRVLRPLYRRA